MYLIINFPDVLTAIDSDQHLCEFFKTENVWKNEAICFENLDLSMIPCMIRKLWFYPDSETNYKIPNIDEFNKKFKFEREKCMICEKFCDSDYQGSFNLVVTEKMIADVNEGDLNQWIKISLENSEKDRQNHICSCIKLPKVKFIRLRIR